MPRARRCRINIVLKALKAPIRQIAENAGVEGSIVVGNILENKSETYGDAQTEEYVDMVAKGIIDPAKVVRAALQDASSVAGLLATTEAMVAEGTSAADARRRNGRHGLLNFADIHHRRPPLRAAFLLD
jgi:chaperonin GroEL (HSP60 family)